ncbi:nicotinate-nucleotide diphosphorylase (carboxylating) [Dissulfurispira thermophila]|uniref:Probable nicotinate-nucleotide pyrophosphorylase [carboxylating] n=1 Tax=Dissulfurispira thermophila TaxID=2715679 RepID=A0A7G1H1B1_9BACT|nr:carboxylating nicotinate-nucleotide diphosphorylase [Dissulfurispira thermophila]BCB96398.1 nicotinate-nucleotide diphosphorylase (carboxylating) [Dissulfurispira thermophila]
MDELNYSYLLKETIRIAIQEDIGHGDITSLLIIPDEKKVRANIIAKEDFILAGMPFVREVFNAIDPDIAIQISFDEGAYVKKGSIVAKISGRARSLLAGERISLNILQRISGIATMTNQFVKKIGGLSAKIADTRKTMPGMRIMEKYGVRIGGGVNHRFGLYDGILIKDNHIKIAGSIKKAIDLAKKGHHLLKIEIEVKNLDELKEALDAGVDVIMLDNMSILDMAKAVKIAKGKAIVEASGNVSMENVRSIAETGVDIISIGALTHSARAVDISMKIV